MLKLMKPRVPALLVFLTFACASLLASVLFSRVPPVWGAPAHGPAVPAAEPAPATPPSGTEAASPATPEPSAPAAISPATPRPQTGLGEPVEEPPRGLFRIGYLIPPGESVLDQEWYRALKTDLETDAAFGKAMREAGISGVALRPSGHPEDLLQRMLAEEFDLAFCPAMVYVQERVARQNRGDAGRYRVLFRTLRSEDASDTRSSEQVRRRGVLFVRRASALGQIAGEPAVQDVKRLLHGAALAVSGSYDAAGFFYVRKMLWEEFDRCEPGEFLFYGSPQEAVKAVISGLCDAGACEESVLREVLESIPGRPDPRTLVRVIRETGPLPTDPVVIHERYDPAARRSDLGRAAHDALRAFYDANAERGAPRLYPGRDSAYDPMEDDLKLTRQWGW